MNRDTLRQVLVVLAVIAVIAVNIIAVALPLNGLDTGEISDRFDIYFVPAGYVFSIWSLIYLIWLFLWHYEVFNFTLVAMLAILLSLIAIYLRLDVGRVQVSTGEKWCVNIPFSTYLGWISVATIANTTQLLYYLGWNGWGISPEIWAVIMLAAGVVISAAMSLRRADIAYSLVLVWAYVGIALEHASTSIVATSAWIAAGLILVILVIGVYRKYQRQN